MKFKYKVFTSLPWREGLREGVKIDHFPSKFLISVARRQVQTLEGLNCIDFKKVFLQFGFFYN
jgi:hypothetical protein